MEVKYTLKQRPLNDKVLIPLINKLMCNISLQYFPCVFINSFRELTERKLRRLIENELGYQENELEEERLKIKSIVKCILESDFHEQEITTDLFPRKTGHCETHIILESEMKLEDHCSPLKTEFARALDIIRQRPKTSELYRDLIRGDLVEFKAHSGYRNDGIFIFDGKEIIELESEWDDFGEIPKQFQVIQNDVPITYWHHTKKQRGILHNSFVSFDHTKPEIQTQMLKNLGYNQVDGVHWAFNTRFEVNSKTFYVIFDHASNLVECDEANYKLSTSDDVKKVSVIARAMLKDKKQIQFHYEGIALFGMSTSNTLYVTLDEDSEAYLDIPKISESKAKKKVSFNEEPQIQGKIIKHNQKKKQIDPSSKREKSAETKKSVMDKQNASKQKQMSENLQQFSQHFNEQTLEEKKKWEAFNESRKTAKRTQTSEILQKEWILKDLQLKRKPTSSLESSPKIIKQKLSKEDVKKPTEFPLLKKQTKTIYQVTSSRL